MKKVVSAVLILGLVALAMTGCSSGGSNSGSTSGIETVKTGMGINTSVEKSTNATPEKEGVAEIDSYVAAVTVDKDGKIVDCILDAVQSKINFNAEGKLTTPVSTMFKTKDELGAEYGMAKASGIGKEWNEQAKALAEYAKGKTIADIKGVAVNEKGAPTGAELASSVTISIAPLVGAIDSAVANAQDFGAKSTDKLGLAISTNMEKSTDATPEKEGLAQAYSTYVTATFDGDKITSMILDGTQGNVNFSTTGVISTDLTKPVETKNELGTSYGLGKASSIGKEWNEQAAAYAKYAIGKTPSELMGLAVTDKGAPSDSELASSVTIGIGDFNTIIETAYQNTK